MKENLQKQFLLAFILIVYSSLALCQSGFSVDGSILFNAPNITDIRTVAADLQGGYSYWSLAGTVIDTMYNCANGCGTLIKVFNSNMTQVATNNFTFEIGSILLDTANNVGYIGFNANKAIVNKISLSTLLTIASVTFNPAGTEESVRASAADFGRGLAYFGTYSTGGAIFVVNLTTFTIVTSYRPPATLEVTLPYTGFFREAILDPFTRLSYWLVGSQDQTTPTTCRVIRFNIVTTQFSVVDLDAGERQCLTMFMNFDDTATLYVASDDASYGPNPHAPIVKVEVLPTLQRVLATNADQVEPYLSSALDPSTNIAYLGTSTRNASLVYFNVTSFTYIGRDTLSIASVDFIQTQNARAMFLDGNTGHLYVGLGLPLGALRLKLKTFSAAVITKPTWAIQGLLIIVLACLYGRI